MFGFFKKKIPSQQNRHPLLMLRLKYDAAQTTSENARHWSMADGLSIDRSLTPEIRRTLRKRTFAHLNRYRRLSKDYEVRLESSEATVKLANIAIVLRRLAPNSNEPKFYYRDKCHKA